MTIEEKRYILIEQDKEILSDTVSRLVEAENVFSRIVAEKAKSIEMGCYNLRQWKVNGMWYTLELAMNCVKVCADEVQRIQDDLESAKYAKVTEIAEIYEVYELIGIVPTNEEYQNEVADAVWNLQHEN